MSDTHEYNAWTSPWLPVVQPDGSTRWASPVDVLAGDVDGPDLDYPRDDFRVYGRLLLSALVQALLPAATKAELEARIAKPMARDEILKRIEPVVLDFDLFGERPFLQVARSTPQPDKGATPFVFVPADIYQPPAGIELVSLPIALVALFAEQAFAGAGGRGHIPGPAGEPGVMTLIDPGGIRAGAWANTLTSEFAAGRYAKDDATPWSNEIRSARPRASYGLVAGIYFQPRGISLEWRGVDRCSFSGDYGPVARFSRYGSKSVLPKKDQKVQDVWQHPCTPMIVNSTGNVGVVRLSSERPAWTGLAQLLRPVRRDRSAGKKAHPNEGPAPVVQQWKALKRSRSRSTMIVLDFERDKATVRRRFFEAYSLADHFLRDEESVERLREVTDAAQSTLSSLERFLVRAHDDRKRGGLALADSRSRFWVETEPGFLGWLDVVNGVEDWNEQSDAVVASARGALDRHLSRAALEIFDSQVEMSEFDPAKQARIAGARRGLIRALAANDLPANPKKQTEVTS